MILLTVDTSAESEAAVPTAVELARRFDLPIRALLVIDGSLRHHFAQVGRDRGATAEELAREHLDAVARALGDAGITEVETAYQHATDAGSTIVEAAEDPDVVLLVMATHGRSGLSRLLTGSVTEHVIRWSPVPVVVVPTRRGTTADG